MIWRQIACVNGIIYIEKEDGTLEKLVMEEDAKEKMQSIKIPDVREFKASPIWDSVIKGRI